MPPTRSFFRQPTAMTLLFFLALSLFSFPSISNAQVPAFLPKTGDVPPGKTASLDGVWLIDTINKKIRIEAGRAYAVDTWIHMFALRIEPGMVVIKNIAMTSPGNYTGDDLPLMGKWTANLQGDRKLAVSVASTLGPVNYKLVPVQIDSEDWLAKEMMVAGLITQPPDYRPPPPVGIPTPPTNPPEAPIERPRPPRKQLPPASAGCGGLGQVACGKDAKVDAIVVGKAKKWGCKGKNNYFTPKNGGECWACPDGFKRTTTPIHKPNSCKKRGLKIGKKERKSARFVSSAFGCPKGQFHKGKSCYSCPAGTTKISFLGAFNPGARCKSKMYCKNGLSLTPNPPKSLMKLGPNYRRRCDKKFKPHKVILPMAKHHMGLASGINVAAGAFAFDVLKNKALRKAIKDKNGPAITRAIKKMNTFKKLKAKAQAKGYQSVSIGVGSGVKAGVGLDQELGVALDWNAGIRFYSTTVLSKGFALSAGGGISLGVWTIGKDELGGYSHGVSTSVPGGVVDIGGGTWFSYYPIEFIGLAYTAGMGVGMEVGVYNEALTQLYN